MGSTVVIGGGIANAGPSGPASFGVMEPTGIAASGCPWPDAANGYMQNVQGVQKCLPQAIPWSYEVGEQGPQSGVRIVSDAFEATGVITGATGEFTFWCQSRVGLHYRVTVQHLAPNTVYPVWGVALAPGSPTDFGTLRTDPNGNGVTGGVITLPKAAYAFMPWVGNVLKPLDADPVIGFSVL
jgi:hypothetical protein